MTLTKSRRDHSTDLVHGPWSHLQSVGPGVVLDLAEFSWGSGESEPWTVCVCVCVCVCVKEEAKNGSVQVEEFQR